MTDRTRTLAPTSATTEQKSLMAYLDGLVSRRVARRTHPARDLGSTTPDLPRDPGSDSPSRRPKPDSTARFVRQ